MDDKYILKSAITACPPPPDMSQYVLKSSVYPKENVDMNDYIHKSTLNSELTENEVKVLVEKYIKENGGGYINKNDVLDLINKYSNNMDKLKSSINIPSSDNNINTMSTPTLNNTSMSSVVGVSPTTTLNQTLLNNNLNVGPANANVILGNAVGNVGINNTSSNTTTLANTTTVGNVNP